MDRIEAIRQEIGRAASHRIRPNSSGSALNDIVLTELIGKGSVSFDAELAILCQMLLSCWFSVEQVRRVHQCAVATSRDL